MTVLIIFWGINLFTVNSKYWVFTVVTVLFSKKRPTLFFQLFHTIPCYQPKFVAEILSKNDLLVFFFSVFFDFWTEDSQVFVFNLHTDICDTEKVLYVNLFCSVIKFYAGGGSFKPFDLALSEICTSNNMFERSTWDKLPECVFQNF